MKSLPIPLTSFIGRENECADLLRVAISARLITLTGAGGCGKTRLALWLANRLKGEFLDGVVWVELASVVDSDIVPQVLGKALNISIESEANKIDALVDHLRDRSALIVFDNCEHLVTACASLAGKLLEAPKLRLLTTSRKPLSVSGETIYPVLPLSLPPV